MKVFLKNTKIFKIIVSLLVILLLINFINMPKVYADTLSDIWHKVQELPETIKDKVTDAIEEPLAKAAARILLGAVTGLACIPEGIAVEMNNAFCASDVSKADMLEDASSDDTKQIKLSPETIINGKFVLMNANIFKKVDKNSTDYYDVSTSDSTVADGKNELRTTIATWYKALRNFSAVALLSILVYVAIRMVMSSASTDKAKYKMMLKDWFVALCLVVLMHFIMIAMINISSLITEAIGTQSITTKVEQERENLLENYNNAKNEISNIENFNNFNGNFMDYLRKMLPDILIYAALVSFTVAFVVKYMIRALTIMFLTLLAPVTAITYPIDKIGDGKSQAYNMWFKEYFFNVIIQPFHLLIYTVLIGAAQTLADKNIFYCILCYAMIFPAEKIIKQMFGLDKAKLGSPFAAGAAGATAANLLNKATKAISSGGKKTGSSGENGDSGKSGDESTLPPKQKSDGELGAYDDGTQGGALPERSGDSDGSEGADSEESTQHIRANNNQPIGDGTTDEAVAAGAAGAAAGANASNDESSNEEQESVPTRELDYGDNSANTSNNSNNNNVNAPSKLTQINRGIRNEIGKKVRSKYGTTKAITGGGGIRGTIKGFKDSKGKKFRLARALGEGIKGHFDPSNRNGVANQMIRKGLGAVGRTAMKGGMAALGAAAVGMFAVATGNPKSALAAMGAGAGLGAAAGKRINGINSKISSGGQKYIKAGYNAAKGDGAKRKEAKNNYLQNQNQRDYVTQRLIDQNGYMPSGKEVDAAMEDRWRFIEDNGITDNNILDAEVDMMKEKENAYFDTFKADGYDDIQSMLDGNGKENKEFRKDYKELEKGKISKYDMDQKYGEGTYDKARNHIITDNKYAADENKEKISNQAFAQTSYAAQLGDQYKKPEFRDGKKMGQLHKSITDQGVSRETANRVIRDAAKIKGEKNPNIPKELTTGTHHPRQQQSNN